MTVDKAFMRLKREAEAGRLQMGHFRTRRANGTVRKLRHFWPAT